MRQLKKVMIGPVAVLVLSLLSSDVTADTRLQTEYEFGDEASCDYYLDGKMPTFVRHAPVAFDDPNRSKIDAETPLSYAYGYVFDEVNDYYFYNAITGEWEGKAPKMDTGVLIGGNAYSKHDAMEMDNDGNDFNRILPYGTIYVDPEKLTYEKGHIEYEFFTDVFKYNNSKQEVPDYITLSGRYTDYTSYQVKYPDVTYPKKHDTQRPVDWEGIVYTGGIKKTVQNEDGTFTETVVRNDANGMTKLFTVRYKDAAGDEEGNVYDLVLTFREITFVAEADVTGALAILSSNNLYVAPILYENGKYTIIMDDETNGVDVHDQDGVRIGARYVYDYSVEDANGRSPEGLIMYSMNDLDNASMASRLQTDANWGTNALGNDFRWAEGFGIVNGAASFAVLPYFNHQLTDVNNRPLDNYNGDESLLRISRMEGTVPDGTANGLYFTTSITAISGTGARNDADTLDTGISLLIESKGSFVSTISAGRRGDVNITLFDSRAANRIEQGSSEGGRIYALDHSFTEDGDLQENTDPFKVVGGGTTSTHYMVPESRHRIYSIRIDGVTVYYRDLKWTREEGDTYWADYTINEEYGRLTGATTYRFHRNNDGVYWVSFEDIQDSHEIYATFARFGLYGILRSVNIRTLGAILLVAGFALLVIISCISWMVYGRKKVVKP